MSRVDDALLGDARLYSFVQAVRLLQGAHPEAVLVGGAGPASQEVVRFRPWLSMGFPPTDVRSVEEREDPDGARRYLLEATFLALYGTASPLPAQYTIELLHQDDEESAERTFLDLFHHRIYSLFYRACIKYRWALQYEPGAEDRFSGWMLALLGLDALAATADLPFQRGVLLRYAGLLARRPRPSVVIDAIVSEYFDGVPVESTPFIARTVAIAGGQRARLGGANCTLGDDLVIGDRVLDRSGRFRMTLGPLDFAGYVSFLPGERKRRVADLLIGVGLSDPLEWEIALRLDRDEVPDLTLAPEATHLRLGQTTWLGRPAGDPCILFEQGRESPRPETWLS